MQYNDYQTAAMRTLNVKTQLENILHCVLGMSGEIAEFIATPFEQREARMKELGDCMWYAAVCANQMSYTFGALMDQASVQTPSHKHTPEIRAVINAGIMLDEVKKAVFYDKPLNTPMLLSAMLGYLQALLQLAEKTSIDMRTVCAMNIQKLQKRYPDKFDSDRAINRDVEAESV